MVVVVAVVVVVVVVVAVVVVVVVVVAVVVAVVVFIELQAKLRCTGQHGRQRVHARGGSQRQRLVSGMSEHERAALGGHRRSAAVAALRHRGAPPGAKGSRAQRAAQP